MISTCALSVRTKTTSLKQPKELTCFNRTAQGTYKYTDAVVPHFYFPRTEVQKRYNLFSGLKKFVPFKDVGEMDGFLGAIQRLEQKQGAKVEADIICFRGLMTKILTFLHFSEDGLSVNIVKYDGQIFMKENQASKDQDTPEDPNKQKFTFCGYKFETLTTLDKPWSECLREEIELRDKKVVSNAEQYLVVVKTGIEKIRMVLGAEVDCVFDYKPRPEDADINGKDSPLKHYVELKTSRIIEHDGQAVTFERKLYKTWAQCFLMGIPKVFYGFRDDNGELRQMEQFETEKIPLILRESRVRRNPNNPRMRKINCVDSLKWFAAVLEWIKATVVDDSAIENNEPQTIYRLSFTDGKLGIIKLNSEETLRINKDEPVITKEFIQWREGTK